LSESAANDPEALQRAHDIARQAIAGEMPLLLACRNLADLRAGLSGVAEGTLDTFVAVASETDTLPIGDERQYWEAAALLAKDREAAEYLERVKDAVEEALRQLLVVQVGVPGAESGQANVP
jgi:hypothetical protein